MSDMLLPQVSPAPPKAPAKPLNAAEPVAESQTEQGFSKVLQTRMQAEESPAEPVATAAEEAPDPASGPAAGAPEDGKPLPPSGTPLASVPAALTETHPETQPAVAPVQEAAVELPPGIAVLFPQDPLRPTPAGRAPAQQSLPQGHTRPLPGPLATGARQELPETAQASVAQAVRDALAENAETGLPRPALESFGAQVRAVATAQTRGVSAEAVLERLLPTTPAQSTPTASVTPTALQPALPQDVLAGTRALLPATTLDTPFRQPGWDQALSERVMWVANQRFQGAEIKLNPPQLGPIEVRVQLQHEQAHISFTAQHASVREALEAALPRLREMFTANGFSLVDVNVSQHSFAEQQRHAQERANSLRAGVEVEGEHETGSVMQQELGRTGAAAPGGIDLFV